MLFFFPITFSFFSFFFSNSTSKDVVYQQLKSVRFQAIHIHCPSCSHCKLQHLCESSNPQDNYRIWKFNGVSCSLDLLCLFLHQVSPAVTYQWDSVRLEEKSSCHTCGIFLRTHTIVTVLLGQEDLAQMYKVEYFSNLCSILFNPANES